MCYAPRRLRAATGLCGSGHFKSPSINPSGVTMKFKQLVAGAVLGGIAALASPVVMAGALTGNADVVSDYVFRGVDQTGTTPAVQGGVDYSFDIGAYAGLWSSNSLTT